MLVSTMIITTEIFIDEIYSHLQKICQHNKTTMPPRDSETIQKISQLIDSSLHEIDLEVLNRTKKNIYKEWKKNQKGLLYVHRGFYTSFRFAIDQSIPRSLDQIHMENPGLNVYHMEKLEKVNKQHFRWFKEEMVFQKGTAQFIHTYGRFIPNEDFLFRSNSALHKSKQLNIPEIERWSFITGSLWEFIKSENINVDKTKIKPLANFPVKNIPKRNIYHFDH